MRSLVERVKLAGMEDGFGEILVPTEEVVEMRNGQKRKSERKFFPAHSRARRALREVLSRRTLPATVVSARMFSSSGEARANSKATTSSAPGSVSMIKSIFSAAWALVAVIRDKSSRLRSR